MNLTSFIYEILASICCFLNKFSDFLSKFFEFFSLNWRILSSVTRLILTNVLELNKEILKEGNSLILNLVKNITDDENRFKRINVQKISSLKELFNSPINEVSFEVRSENEVQKISKILKENGKTLVNINLATEDNILQFKLKNLKNLDRKSLNLLRKQQIQATIS